MYQHVAVEEGQAPAPIVAPPRSHPIFGILQRIGSVILSNRKAMLGVIILAVFVLMAVFAPAVAPYDPNATDAIPSAPPSHDHWLGTTSYGQDILSQII